MAGTQTQIEQLIRKALRCPHGWTHEYRSGGHSLLTHPSGRTALLPSSTSDRNSPRNIARLLNEICGCDFWPRAGVGRKSRKAVKMSGFSIDAAVAANAAFHEENPDHQRLTAEHDQIMAELHTVDPRTPHARVLARRLCVVQSELAKRHIVIPEQVAC